MQNDIYADRLAAWVKALRSGNYQQGRGVLRNHYTNEFCCLGVACDLYDKIEVVGKGQESHWQERNDGVGPRTFWEYEGSYAVLPVDVYQYFGLTDCGGEIKPEFARTDFSINSLWNYNDSGFSFEKIADMLEAGYAQGLKALSPTKQKELA